MNIEMHIQKTIRRHGSFVHVLKKTVVWVGRKAQEQAVQREEYHLTPKDRYLQSQTMVLNGRPLELSSDGSIPTLDPVLVDVQLPISVAPLSIAFTVLPHFEAPACR